MKDLRPILSNLNYNIVIINESWLSDHTLDSEIAIKHYTFIRSDRFTDTIGGGIIIYFRNDLKHYLLPIQSRTNIEVLTFQLVHNSKKLIGCVIYRPPNKPFSHDTQLIQLLDNFINIPADYRLICGDFNIADYHPLNNFNTHPITAFLNDNLMQQFVHSPSRREHFLDLIFSNVNVRSVRTADFIPSCDHFQLQFNIPFTGFNPIRHRPSVHKFTDWNQFNNFCSNIN